MELSGGSSSSASSMTASSKPSSARLDLEREVEVERAIAPLLGMQVDLPRLAQRVRLDEVALVVHVEAMVDRVILEIGDEAGDVDDRHVSRLVVPSARRNPAVACVVECDTWPRR